MFKAGLGLAGFGLIVLAGVALATPAFAQRLHIEGAGVSVGIGDRDHRSYDYDRRHRNTVVIRDRDSYAAARCKTTRTIRSDGSVKTVRRCR